MVRWPPRHRRPCAGSTGCLPTWWRAVENRWQPEMFSRAFGSAAPTSATVSPSASSPRSKISAARIALSTTDSAAAESGSTDRSTLPLWDSSHWPSVKGAEADASMGMPTEADRTAATTHPLLMAGATEAKEASPHSGAALRQRRGVGPVPPSESLRSCPPGSKNPTPQPSAFTTPVLLTAGRIRLHEKAIGHVEHQRCHRDGCAQPTEVPTHHASQANRTPEKICLRIGWSQLRKLGRMMLAATDHAPPRRIL